MLPLLITLLPLAPPQDLAAGHPAAAQLYLEIADVEALGDAYAGSAVARMLGDAELQAILGRLLGQDALDPRTLLEEQYDQAVERGDIPPLRELLADPLRSLTLSATVDGGLASLIETLEYAENDEEVGIALLESVAIQLHLDFVDGDSALRAHEFIERAIDDQGEVLREATRVDSVEVVSYTPDGAPMAPFHTSLSGERWTLLIGGDAVELAGRLSGREEGFARSRLAAGGLLEVPGRPVLQLYNALVEEFWTVPEAEAGALTLDLAEGLFGSTATMLLRGGIWQIGVDDRGRFVTEGFRGSAATPAQRVFGGARLDMDALHLIHPDAIVAKATHFDKHALIEAVERAAALAGEEDPMAAIEEQIGVHPLRDLLEPLGPAMAYSLPAPNSLLSAPPLSLAFALEDRATFEAGLTKLLRFAEEQGGGFFAVVDSDYRDMRLLTLQFDFPEGLVDLPIPIDLSALIRPTFVVMDSRFFLTTLPQHAKKEVRRLLRTEVEKHAMLEDLDLPADVAEVGFADWMQFFGQVYTGGRALANLAGAGAGEELPFDPAGLPDAELILEYFEPTVRWRRFVEGGVIDHERSSFGPDALLVAPLLGAAVLVGQQAATLAVPAEPQGGAARVWQDEVIAAETRLRAAKVACELYRIDFGEYPADLDALNESEGAYMEGRIENDPWGRRYRYAIREEKVRLWSIGPNGTDEDGGGDDVLVTD